MHNAENGKYTSVNVCPVLCDFDLGKNHFGFAVQFISNADILHYGLAWTGGKKCDCNSKPFKIPKNPEELCDAICQSFKINIRGCSKCAPNERDTTVSIT